jgi:membrane-associated phospholipid phosphatase
MSVRNAFRASQSPPEDELLKEKVNYKSSSSKKGVAYVWAPIDKLGPWGRWFRHTLLDGILVGTPVLLTIQRHRNPKVTKMMRVLSFLGTEDFYTVLYFFLSWMLDARLGRLFGILMGICFYIAGFFKTLLCLPRPPSPPIVPLENAYDWALPSHHSLLGVVLPWYIWLYSHLHFEMTSFQMTALISLIVLWSFGVLLSRLYLGVHSPADIVCGGIIGVIVLCLLMLADDYVDWYISQQSLQPQLKIFVLVLLLLYVHPIATKGTPSFTDTIVTSGVIRAIIVQRSQRTRLMGTPSLLESNPHISVFNFIKLWIFRLVLGSACIGVLKVVLKFIVKTTAVIGYRIAGLEFYSSSSIKGTLPKHSRHYTADFKIPPVELSDDALLYDEYESENEELLSDSESKEDEKSSKSKEKKLSTEHKTRTFSEIVWKLCFHSLPGMKVRKEWDIDIPVKFIVYTLLTYTAAELLPQLYILLGI